MLVKKDLRDFNKLISDERVDYVLEKSLFYGFERIASKRFSVLQSNRRSDRTFKKI